MEIYNSVKSALINSDVKDNKTIKILINKKGVVFPLALNFKESSKLVFFFPGAFDTSQTMPKFQRSGYFTSLDCNAVSFFDPTLFLSSDIAIGWFQGRNQFEYIDLLSEIIAEIVAYLKIDNRNILFFSTSAGGIPAVKAACLYEGSNIYAGNIQVDIFKYYQKSYTVLVETILGQDGNASLYKELYPSKYNILNIESNINMYYSQNKKDLFHYKNHYEYFMSNYHGNKSFNLESVVYFDDKSGHNPISKELELRVIDSIFEGKGIAPVFKDYISL